MDTTEYKAVAGDPLVMSLWSLRHQVQVRAPHAITHHVVIKIKEVGGWDQCEKVKEALVAAIDATGVLASR